MAPSTDSSSRPAPHLQAGKYAWVVTWDGIVIIDGPLDEADERTEQEIRDDLADAGIEETEDQDQILAFFRDGSIAWTEGEGQ